MQQIVQENLNSYPVVQFVQEIHDCLPNIRYSVHSYGNDMMALR